MSETDEELTVLLRGLEQVESLLAEVTPERLGEATPCGEWTVRDLVDHLGQAPVKFARSVRGQEVDWSADAPGHEDWLAAYRQQADDLRAWRDVEGTPEPGPAWQTAEFAVHSWDLAQSLGHPTGDLDPTVAERGYAFMRATLAPEMRGSAFAPEQPAPEGADAYQRIAAFAGRTVPQS
ncbi:MAG: TIGR03086 family metal-binding protein [Thermocrispum sp.]